MYVRRVMGFKSRPPKVLASLRRSEGARTFFYVHKFGQTPCTCSSPLVAPPNESFCYLASPFSINTSRWLWKTQHFWRKSEVVHEQLEHSTNTVLSQVIYCTAQFLMIKNTSGKLSQQPFTFKSSNQAVSGVKHFR